MLTLVYVSAVLYLFRYVPCVLNLRCGLISSFGLLRALDEIYIIVGLYTEDINQISR